MDSNNCAALDLFELTILEAGITIIPDDGMQEDVAIFRVKGVKLGDVLTLRIEDMGAFAGRGSHYELRDAERTVAFDIGPHQEVEQVFSIDFDEETLEIWAWPLTDEIRDSLPVADGSHQRIMRLVFDTGVPAKK